MRKTIFINGRFLTHAVTGVQRYARELMRHMDRIAREGDESQRADLVCLAPRGVDETPAWRNIPIRRIGVNRGNLWEQIDLPVHARGGLIFSPANSGPWFHHQQVITLHDAAVFARPVSYSSAFRFKYGLVFNQLARRARRVLTDSDFSRLELARFLNLPGERFTVIPLGADHLDTVRPDASILDRHGLRKDSYLLTVGSRSLHKNVHSVLDALQVLETDVKLVSVGGSFETIFRKTKPRPPARNFLPLGYVSDAELKALYEKAAGSIFPSTYEGFCLPALEAMRAGCPTLCAHAASLPEVLGSATLYFDPEDVQDIAARIGLFLSSPDLRRQLRENGILQADRYKWSDTAERTLRLLVDISQEGRAARRVGSE